MIVNTSVKYNSNILKSDINSLMLHYPFINLITIGYSVLEKPIYCIKLGNGPTEVFYFGAIHANEWITCNLLIKFIEDLCNAYSKNSNIIGYNIRNIFKHVTFYIVPMSNPDGVDLVNGNINLNSNAYLYARYISNKYPSIPFPDGWKANIKGVDFKKLPTNLQSLVIIITRLYKIFIFLIYIKHTPLPATSSIPFSFAITNGIYSHAKGSGGIEPLL